MTKRYSSPEIKYNKSFKSIDRADFVFDIEYQIYYFNFIDS